MTIFFYFIIIIKTHATQPQIMNERMSYICKKEKEKEKEYQSK